MSHKMLVLKDIPAAQYKDFKQACVYFDISIRDALIHAMQDLVTRWRRIVQGTEAGPIYKQKKEKKK
ncbi:hypothetical protein ES702_05316 [subsurface metagenome]